MNSLLPTPPLAPRGVRYPRTGTYRRCAGLDCGAVKPAAAFEHGSGGGFYHFCDTCRSGAQEQRAAQRAARIAAHRQERPARRFWLRQLQQRARASA